MRIIGLLLAFLAWMPSSGLAQTQPAVIHTHGLSLHGQPKYPADFRHFEYADPDAPKAGELRSYAIGTFDTLNPYTLKGISAAGLGNMYDTLMANADDEPYCEYGLLAEDIEVPADLSWVIFTLRKEARFHDGQPITPEDVIFSFSTLKTHGHPQYRFYYENVLEARKIGPSQVKFIFAKGENRELPHIIGQLPVLPRHYWKNRQFEKTTLEPPLGSGPYRIATVDPGRSITYRRVADYWGKDLPVKRGLHNFDKIRYDYYRDSTVALQAFLAGEYDFRLESAAKDWATAYHTPAVSAGLIRTEEIPHKLPQGMQGYVFNIRRPLFKDRRVRQALGFAFDFEWSNKNLFYGQYTRTQSYFANSELASSGLAGPQELAILEPLREKIPAEVFTQPYQAPQTDGSGYIRKQLGQALALLKEAGWNIKSGKMVHAATAEPFSFEILLNSPSLERVTLPYIKNLQQLGLDVRLRTVDAAQYQQRVEVFDFDMIVDVFGQSSSPGNEQRDFWGSAAANQPGSRNTIGIQDPAVDRLIDLVIAAPDRDSLINRTRALDRVLLWNFYVIPHWHLGKFRIAYWDKFGQPQVRPAYNLPVESWWVDPDKEARLARGRQQLK